MTQLTLLEKSLEEKAHAKTQRRKEENDRE
jgi:hypothetical protein